MWTWLQANWQWTTTVVLLFGIWWRLGLVLQVQRIHGMQLVSTDGMARAAVHLGDVIRWLLTRDNKILETKTQASGRAAAAIIEVRNEHSLAVLRDEGPRDVEELEADDDQGDLSSVAS